MIEKYIYSHNDDLKYFSENDLKHRGKLVQPLFIEKITWYLLLLVYCIWVRKNVDYINVSDYTNHLILNSPVSYLLALIYLAIVFTGIKLTVRTVQLYAISATNNNETEIIIKKKIFKKWSTYILNTVFSISLVNYISGGGKFIFIELGVYTWFNILLIVILVKIIVKLLGLLISKMRISMISESLEDSIEEVKNKDFKKVSDCIRELVGNGEGIELVWGLAFKNVLLEMIKLFDKIEETTKKEKELYKNKNHLITNLSHSFKIPLTSIINSIYMLKNEILNKEEREEQISILESKVERLNTLIKDINETINTKYEGLIVNKKTINIKKLVEEELQTYEMKFNKLNLDIKVDFPTTEVNLFIDEEKTVRIVDNILSNISKYSLECTRVYIDMNDNKEYTQIVFKNISKYDIEVNTIGERFVQGDESINIEGNGLGLSIVKNLMDIQGGDMKVDVLGDLFKLTLKFKNIV